MRVALIGNGLEIEFQNQLTKENMIKNALEGKLSYNRMTQKSNYPSAIKVFADMHELSYENIDKNPLRWKWIEDVLKGENSNKSIEDLFMDVEIALQDSSATEEFKNIFLKYIEYFSSEIKSQFFEKEEYRWNYNDGKYKSTKNRLNFLNEKFRNYDLILTTNYTDFIEKNLNEENKSKVVHLHGEFDKQDNLPLLGGDKLINVQMIMLKVEESIVEGLKKIKDEEIDLTKIELDIFGWSFSNEHDLIQIIINIILDWYYKDSDFLWTTSYNEYTQSRTSFIVNESGGTRKKTELNLPIVINYYYYVDKKGDSNDLSAAEKYKKNNENFWKGSIFLAYINRYKGHLVQYRFPTFYWQQKIKEQDITYWERKEPESHFMLFDKPIKFEIYPYTNFSLTNNDLEQFKK